MTRTEPQDLSIDGMQVSVRSSSATDGPVFVLIHGLGVSSAYFGPLAARLAEHGRVVSLDLPGFGRSRAPARALRIPQFAAVAYEAARRAGALGGVWVGHSMGAQVVTELLAGHPDAGRGGVLVCPVVNRAERRGRTLARRFVQNAFRETPASAATSVWAFVRCGPKWAADIFPAMLAYPIEERIAEVTCDLRLVGAARDAMAPLAWVEELASRTSPRAPVDIVDGAAHQVLYSEPDIVARAVLSLAGGTVTRPRLGEIARDWWIAARDQIAALRPARAVPPRPAAECRSIPVVLLPGIYETARYMSPLARWLEGYGHPVRMVPALGWNVSTLAESAQHGGEVLGELASAKTVIVAHSKGGLIGKAMLSDPRTRGLVAGMVAMCTPFGGSLWSGRLQAYSRIQRSPLGLFHPEHPDLVNLAATEDVNSRIVSLVPLWDQVVMASSVLPGATNVHLDIGGHFRPVSDPATWVSVHTHMHALARSVGAETAPG